ncbi:MAG: hypothetical protein RL141_975 [Candidatus Parcubacteria bacterium]|jgi:chromate reductase
MTTPLRILGISGSLRKESYNKKLLDAAKALCPDGAEMTLLDWANVPLFNQDLEMNPPQAVTEVKAAIRAADAIVFATPEYNYSIPGPLKNLIDWASRPYGDSAWQGKPVAVIGAAFSRGGSVRAQMALRQCFLFLNMPPVQSPEVFVTDFAHTFDAEGRYVDEDGKKAIRQVLENLVALTTKLKG